MADNSGSDYAKSRDEASEKIYNLDLPEYSMEETFKAGSDFGRRYTLLSPEVQGLVEALLMYHTAAINNLQPYEGQKEMAREALAAIREKLNAP